MIQRMLAIWSLVPLPFLKPAWTSGSSRFTDCWSLAWRILSITLLACEMSASKPYCDITSHLSKLLLTKNTILGQGYREMRLLVHCWQEFKRVQPLWKTVWRFLKKLKIELPYDPAVLLLDIYPNNTKNTNSKRYMYPHIQSSLITLAKIWKQPKHP